MSQIGDAAGQGGTSQPRCALGPLAWALIGLFALMLLVQWLHRPIAPCGAGCSQHYSLLHWQWESDAEQSMRILLHWSHGEVGQNSAASVESAGTSASASAPDGNPDEAANSTGIPAANVTGDPAASATADPSAVTPDPRLLQRLRHGLAWDFGLILSYALLGWLLTPRLLDALGMTPDWSRRLACCFPLAALADVAENLVAWQLLSSWPLNPAAVRCMTGYAMTKWALLLIGAVILAFGVLLWLRKPGHCAALLACLKRALS